MGDLLYRRPAVRCGPNGAVVTVWVLIVYELVSIHSAVPIMGYSVARLEKRADGHALVFPTREACEMAALGVKWWNKVGPDDERPRSTGACEEVKREE